MPERQEMRSVKGIFFAAELDYDDVAVAGVRCSLGHVMMQLDMTMSEMHQPGAR